MYPCADGGMGQRARILRRSQSRYRLRAGRRGHLEAERDHIAVRDEPPRCPTQAAFLILSRGTSSMAEQPALNRSIGVRSPGAPPLDASRANQFFVLALYGSARACALLFENSCDEKTGRAPETARACLLTGSPPRLPKLPAYASGEATGLSIRRGGFDSLRGRPPLTSSPSPCPAGICRLWFTKPIALGSTPSREASAPSPCPDGFQASASEAGRAWFDSKQGDSRTQTQAKVGPSCTRELSCSRPGTFRTR